MENITWEFLATFAGATTAVTILTQGLKKFFPVDPKWIALFLALAVSFGVQVFYHMANAPADYIMSAFNALWLTLASVGGFECVLKPIKKCIDSYRYGGYGK